jgi:hypothetical protein
VKRLARALPQVVPSGEVVALRPALLNVKAAGAYCSVSSSLLNALRAADAKAIREGRDLAGPKWVVVAGSMVRYRIEALDDWLRINAAELAVVESRRRAAGDP